MTHRPHAVFRRLGADASAEITLRDSKDGETTKAFAEKFGAARNAILNLLRANGVAVRRQPPTDAQERHFADEN